jgi:Tocopherol cyclase
MNVGPTREARGPRVSFGLVSEADNLPAWTGRPGAYEVWFLTLSNVATGNGYWIRSTLSAPADGSAPSAGVWFARFDRSDPAETFGIHRTASSWDLSPDRFEIRVGDAEMGSGRACGSLSGGGHEVRWELQFATGDPTYRLLPDRLYRSSIAPTKPFSPNPRTAVTGAITIDGGTEELRGAPAQQGHLYGSRHAERWAWAQCGQFVDEEAIVHAITAQGRRGPFTTPFFTFVGVQWQGEWIRMSKVRPRRDFGLGTWKIDVSSRRHRLTGRVDAPIGALLRARYLDPSGEDRYCHNSEIASSRLVLFERRARGWQEVALLESSGTTHGEWSGRTPAAAVEREFAEVG